MFNQLYYYRVRKGLTQQKLAELSGVSRGTICSLERSGRWPSPGVAVRLCRALECSFEELFSLGDSA